MQFKPRYFLIFCLIWVGCSHERTPQKKQAPIGRFAAVPSTQKTGDVKDPSGFCELTFPSNGPSSRTLKWPELRPLPGQKSVGKPKLGTRWTWLNLWATWCGPCVAEMGLLERWTRALTSEGMGINLVMLTIDEPKDGHALGLQLEKGVPGHVSWLKQKSDFLPFIAHLGLDPNAAIPIHALIDPTGRIRCVRVGAIHDVDFAAVKGILRGG